MGVMLVIVIIIISAALEQHTQQQHRCDASLRLGMRPINVVSVDHDWAPSIQPG